MTRSASAWLRLPLPLLLLLAGCVHQERSAVSAAQAAHDRCVLENGASHPECEVRKARVRAAQERYEEGARRAWGCDTSRGSCPVVP